MKRQAQVITHPSQLNSLSVLRGFGPQGSGRLKIQDDSLNEDTARTWETHLNRLYFACGCDKGAIGMLLGLVGYPVWLAVQPDGLASLGWNGLWLGLAVVAVTTALGKLVGLVGAQREFKEAVRQVQKEWTAEPIRYPEDKICG